MGARGSISILQPSLPVPISTRCSQNQPQRHSTKPPLGARVIQSRANHLSFLRYQQLCECNRSVQKELQFCFMLAQMLLHASLCGFCAAKMATFSVWKTETEKLKQKYEARRNLPWNDNKLQIVSMLLTSLFPSSDKKAGETIPFLMTQFNLPQGKLLQKQMKALHMH